MCHIEHNKAVTCNRCNKVLKYLETRTVWCGVACFTGQECPIDKHENKYPKEGSLKILGSWMCCPICSTTPEARLELMFLNESISASKHKLVIQKRDRGNPFPQFPKGRKDGSWIHMKQAMDEAQESQNEDLSSELDRLSMNKLTTKRQEPKIVHQLDELHLNDLNQARDN